MSDYDIVYQGLDGLRSERNIPEAKAALVRLQSRLATAEKRLAKVLEELDEARQLPMPETHVLLAKHNAALQERIEAFRQDRARDEAYIEELEARLTAAEETIEVLNGARDEVSERATRAEAVVEAAKKAQSLGLGGPRLWEAIRRYEEGR